MEDGRSKHEQKQIASYIYLKKKCQLCESYNSVAQILISLN